MSTIINGDPSTVSNSTSKTVTNATNASPIVITTSTAHGFATGDNVNISGVGGNTAANGDFVITVLTSTTFSLDSSTGSGAYTSGGTVVDKSLLPAFTIPSDGDTRNAASVNVAFQALADRTQFLNEAMQTGKLRIQQFTAASTVWTAPLYQAAGIIFICGGGGGGGSGGGGSTIDDRFIGGGGGGGGASLIIQPISLIAGGSYTWTRGAGGAGATAGNFASDGSDSTFAITAGATLATGPGAGCGGRSSLVGISTDIFFAAGGGPTAWAFSSYEQSASFAAGTSFFNLLSIIQRPAGMGGMGLTSALNSGGSGIIGRSYLTKGIASLGGYSGGAGGAFGVDSGAKRGGGPGGGGGGGPFGVGGAGGAGGDGGAVTGNTGTNGSAAGANTGAGGGGGGGAGCAGTTPGNASAGGAGGSGAAILVYWSLT